jgi:hypothetical protein
MELWQRGNRGHNRVVAKHILLTLVALQLAGAGELLAGEKVVFEGPRADRALVEDVVLTRAGDNACDDLPRPPDGVPGLREYARISIKGDGLLVVTAAQLPFASNEGYVYRQAGDRWVANEVDYVLLRTPVPVRGGFTYVIAFGGGEERCGRWSIDARHPR